MTMGELNSERTGKLPQAALPAALLGRTQNAPREGGDGANQDTRLPRRRSLVSKEGSRSLRLIRQEGIEGSLRVALDLGLGFGIQTRIVPGQLVKLSG